MREAIPDGIYETLWDWVLASRSQKLPDHELQNVHFAEERVPLTRAIALKEEGQVHPNFHAESFTTPDAFVGVLPEGRYWVADDRTDGIIAPDNKLIWDVSVQYHLPYASHPIMQKPDLPPAEYADETIAVLTYTFDTNYYHWMFEVLARIHLLEQSGIAVDRYILNGRSSATFQAETLALLGIPERKILKSRRGMHVRAKRLVVPSMRLYSLLPFIPNPPQRWAVRYLRSELMGRVSAAPSSGSSHIYISRGDARYRGVTNEDQVAKFLKARGFTIAVPGNMSVAEQIRLFDSAEFVVAPHGAGLANLLFCRPETRVLELFSPNFVNPLYWYLSNQLGLRYAYLIGQGERLPISSGVADIGYRIEPVTVDLRKLEAMLDRLDE